MSLHTKDIVTRFDICFFHFAYFLYIPLNTLNISRDVIYENNSRIHLDRSQNKYTNYKGIKNNTNLGQITGIKEKLDKTCK